MKQQLVLFTVVLTFVLFGSNVYAKKDKIKFGNVSKEELEMTVYDQDTSAPAVILYEGGYYDGDNHQFYIHKRIKILKKEGYSIADDEIGTTAKSNIKGITFNLIDGEIIESKLESESIFVEKLWEYKFKYNVAMPDVKVGSVIDIQVVYNGFPYSWYFQKSIPVVKSELQLEHNDYIEFRKQVGGIIRPKEVGYNHWVAENVPAFISEAYLNSSKNYLCRLEFDISETHFPGYYALKYAYSWKTINTLLNKTKRFGKALDWDNFFLNKYVEIINDSTDSESMKVKLAVETVKSLVEFTGSDRLFMSEDNLTKIYKDKYGCSADINLMLIDLLDKLNIHAYPMVISTRENGMLHPVNPSLWKLNYVVAYVKIDGSFLVIDATSDNLPFDMLPTKCLNYNGQVLNGKNTEKASLVPKKKFIKRSFYDIKLTEEFEIKGNISFLSKDYAAYELRENYDKFLNETDYVEDLLRKHNGLNITDFKIENIEDVDKAVAEKYIVEIEEGIDLIDDQLYLSAFLYDQISENPFKSEERKYPVDFIYEKSNSGVIRIQLPENFSVAELPTPTKISLPEQKAVFSMIYKCTNNIITLNYKLIINSPVFGEEIYADLREFYALVVSNQSKPIIIDINN